MHTRPQATASPTLPYRQVIGKIDSANGIPPAAVATAIVELLTVAGRHSAVWWAWTP